MIVNKFSKSTGVMTTRISDNFMYNEDVQVLYGDNIVAIRQYNEAEKKYELITVSPKMYVEMIYAFELPIGEYLFDFAEKETESTKT
jgi:hypothetical protein